MSTPPPLVLNLLGLAGSVGSVGWNNADRSTRKILYKSEGRISLSVIEGLSHVSFRIIRSGEVLKIWV